MSTHSETKGLSLEWETRILESGQHSKASGIPIEKRSVRRDGDLSRSRLTHKGSKLFSSIRLLIFGLNVRCLISAGLRARIGSSHETRGMQLGKPTTRKRV